MKPDKSKYQHQLLNYALYCNLDIQRDKQLRCPNARAHNHNDNNFSAHYYESSKNGKPQIKCFSCGWVGDVYDLAGIMNNTNEFIEQYKIIDNIFGGGEFELSEKQKEFAKSEGKSGRDMEPVKYVAVQRNRAGHIFRREQIDNCRSFSKFDIIRLGEIKGHWFYDNTEGSIIAVDVRFEYQGKKTVQTFWYDGRRVCSWGVINIIYNLYEAVNCTRPLIIHEGAKCAKIGKSALTNFCNVSYNRGVENADKPDWSVIDWIDRPIYILPDNDEPGIKGANKIKEKLPHAIIITGIYKHFGIEHIKGADIEDLLISGAEPWEIEEYILKIGGIGNE